MQAAKVIRVQERSGDVRAGWLKGQLPERPLSPVEEGQIELGGSRRQNVRTRALEIFRHPAKANLLCESQGKTQDSVNWSKVILDALGIHRGSPFSSNGQLFHYAGRWCRRVTSVRQCVSLQELAS